MTTQLVTLQYNDQISVNFTSDAWFNATTVAKQYNKRPNDWLSLESTKEYIKCLHAALFPEIQLPEKMVIKQNQLLKTKTGSEENGGGSWFHPKLAIAFARWLEVKFSIWCDMQIEKLLHKKQPLQYGLKDHINEPEPLRISYATKEQREPLVKAVRGLVLMAKSKGRNISFEEAHQMVNFSIGVTSVEEMTAEMIPQAIKSVGELFKTIVLEGEFIAKGEAEPAPIIELELPSDPFTNREREQLHHIVSSISDRFNCRGTWIKAIHYRLRKATGCKAPAYYRISDKPAMAKEFGKIFTISGKARDLIRKIELESAKRLMRDDEEFEKVIAEFEADAQGLFTELEGDVKTLLDSFGRFEIKKFEA